MAKRSKKDKMQRRSLGGGGMMSQIQALQEQMLAAQNALAEETVEVTAGGGVIKVVMTGDQRVVSVKVDPAVLEDADAEMLEDLLLSAFNQALEKSKELAAEKLGPLAGGLGGLPF